MPPLYKGESLSRCARSAGYTYPATYKVCTGSASRGRPNPHTGLHRLAPHRCRASARLAWFPDGYRVSIFPYRSALRPNPASRAHRPRYSAFPTAVGGLLALEGPTLRVTTGKASNISALAGRKPRAKILARPPLLPRPLGHHTPYCGRNPEHQVQASRGSSSCGGHWLPMGRGREVGRFPYGTHPHRNRHPHVLGL